MPGNAFNFGDVEVMSIFDSGTSYTMIPDYYWIDYVNLLKKLSAIDKAEMRGGYLAFQCNERNKFPKLYFMFNFFWFELDPDDYIFDASAK